MRPRAQPKSPCVLMAKSQAFRAHRSPDTLSHRFGHANQIMHKTGWRFLIALHSSGSIRRWYGIDIGPVLINIIILDSICASPSLSLKMAALARSFVSIKNASHLASFEDYNVDYDEVSTSHQKSIFNAPRQQR